MAITVKQVMMVQSLPPIDGVSPGMAEEVRLALIANGRPPANPQDVLDLLNGPIEDWMAVRKALTDAYADAPEPEYDDKGGATVAGYKVRPLTGRDFFSWSLNSPHTLIKAVTGLSDEDYEALSYGTYSALKRAVDFLVLDSLPASDSSEKPSPSPDSA